MKLAKVILGFAVFISLPTAFAQNPKQQPPSANTSVDTSKDTTLTVLITGSDAWEMDSKKRTAEVLKSFAQNCRDFAFTQEYQKPAQFVVLLDHAEGGSADSNKLTVFDIDAEAVGTHTTSTVAEAVKNACDAIHEAITKSEEKAKKAKGIQKDGSQPAYIEEKITSKDMEGEH